MNCFKRVICIFLVSTTLARAGNEVGGGGIAENNILYSVQNLEEFMAICLASVGACPLSEREKGLLIQISKSMPEERENLRLIQFESETKKPGFFLVDGHVRTAKTEFHVGSTIYFNLDALYPTVQLVSVPSIPAYQRPFDIPFAVSLLVHELGHHQGERDHTFLDALGAKVQTLMQSYATELDGGPEHRSLIVTALQHANGRMSELLLRDSTTLYTLGDEVRSNVLCKNRQSLLGFSLWNLHWLRSPSRSMMDRRLRMRCVLYCGNDIMVNQVQASEVEITFRTDTVFGKGIIINKQSIQVAEIDCAKAPALCH